MPTARMIARTAPKWDLWARPAGFPDLHAALVWATRHAADAADPIRILSDRLNVPYQVLLSVDVVQKFLHSPAVIDARRDAPPVRRLRTGNNPFL
ncbi:hypothetical protein [Tsukamurella sp. 1534]|uniref:hypothetical protein n=1 Tax=Tsukamurella sp. 1534 TaxID=1151061 RepID=UPI0011D1D517|nr:hypothetical protein [Tsukamurella sp. 1534]